MISRLLNFLLGDKCPTCGKRTLDSRRIGAYTRAYNHMCKQAAGATGQWCRTCKTVQFEEPNFNKWLEKQPPWVRPYNDAKAIEMYKDF